MDLMVFRSVSAINISYIGEHEKQEHQIDISGPHIRKYFFCRVIENRFVPDEHDSLMAFKSQYSAEKNKRTKVCKRNN
ncbi:hypothetical protein DSUL_30030 [Desulfovibrionales bacterium]